MTARPPGNCVNDRGWVTGALDLIEAERQQTPEPTLIEVPLASARGIRLWIKDESAWPSGSLKHRLARSLLIDALCNGWIGPNSMIVEASSGSTAVSVAWFAQLLRLRFVAVVPAATAPEKLALIVQHGGAVRLVDDPRRVCDEARRIADEEGGHFLDQFTHAERATDWRRGSIGTAIFDQLRARGESAPRWIVCGAGTGGTSAAIGRHIRHGGHETRLCVADPEASVFHRHFADRSIDRAEGAMSRVEGIGRPCVVPSFLPGAIDRMVALSDADAFGAARHLSRFLGRRCGPSTGANLHVCLRLIGEMVEAGEEGEVVTLLCDSGDRYASTCFDDAWCAANGLLDPPSGPMLERFLPIH